MRKRSKYRPKPVYRNALALAVEAVTPIGQTGDGYFATLQLRNHAAMQALTHGAAKKADVDLLVAMANIMEALRRMGVCTPLADEILAARRALVGICTRSVKLLRYVATGPEILALNILMEQHDEMMPHITVLQLDRALKLERKVICSGEATVLYELEVAAQASEVTP